MAGASHAHHWNPRQDDYVVDYFNFWPHPQNHSKVWGNQHLLQPHVDGILHKDGLHCASITRTLQTSKSELQTTIDTYAQYSR